MNITDELRKYAQSWRETPNLMDDLDAGDIDGLLGDIEHIADRIDEAHKHAIGYVDDRDPETMAENGWIKLPVDADGKPIRIGDVMEGVDKYDTLKEVRGKVITVSFESDGTIDVAIRAWNSDGRSWHRAYLDQDASVYRHYQPDSWERIIEDAVNVHGNGFNPCWTDEHDALVARCKKLADGGKEQ